MVNQNTKEKAKMTPNDIATDIAGISPAGEGTINMSFNYTYTFERMDDSHAWD